jgi:CheY-like chemotaxis protein/nitrogen-specific signal transduction histidine kinase
VTENRRLIDELLEANRRLEEFNRLKAEFVANMSHELRTPLTAIIGFTQLMEMRATNEHLPAAFMDPIERVLRNSRHLLSLIDDVLDMSKIEAGRIAVHPETFDLVELVQAVFGELAGLAKRKGLEYRLNVKDEFPLAFNDPVRVRQILLNLLSNAIKFTPRGSIEVELQRTGENEWQLTVRDTGVGIRKESLGFIFERFRQVDGSMTRREGGTGLGLSIVQQLVTLLGGRVEVDSEYGAGSTFTVRLPLFALNEKTLDAFALQTLEGRINDSRIKDGQTRGGQDDERSLVLVIEDDADARTLLSETLERAGYRVVTAADGPTGLKMAREMLPTAITLDIMMPSVDGWRVLQAMKADRQTAAIPVIVCSIVDNRPLGYRLGASDYLVKPVKQQDLIQALRNVGAGDEQSDRYVLVIDDERGVRELLVEALKKAGFNAQGAPNGEVALSLSTERTPQAILCDLLMPGMSGFELIARLRTNEATAHTPVIVITSKDVTNEDRNLMRGQIADVIRKGDLLMPDLESRLRETLEEIGVKPSHGEDTVS